MKESKFGMRICRAVAQNPILFDVFHRLGIMEKISSAINRMRETMVERGIEITFETGNFLLSLRQDSKLSSKPRRAKKFLTFARPQNQHLR